MKSINITIEIIKIIVNKAFSESFGKKASIIIVHRKKAKEIILAIHPVTAGHTGLWTLKPQNKAEIHIFIILIKKFKVDNW